ncbi:steroid 3-ketoacyl-CoA thiolase, partial [Streptomyces albulus]|nr:steroid 3-ketoacyl-CoA thiolase [Streptomyces noursei]
MAAEPVIVEAVRTPIGKRGGACTPPRLPPGQGVRELLARTG